CGPVPGHHAPAGPRHHPLDPGCDRPPPGSCCDSARTRRCHGGWSGIVSAILEVESLTKRFGGITAVDRCTFSVPSETITAVIGPNGSGKTTVFNLITGYSGADDGSVTFGGLES